MEEEIFVANSKSDVKALGMKVSCMATGARAFLLRVS
jgi:hypothetical protein